METLSEYPGKTLVIHACKSTGICGWSTVCTKLDTARVPGAYTPVTFAKNAGVWRPAVWKCTPSKTAWMRFQRGLKLVKDPISLSRLQLGKQVVYSLNFAFAQLDPMCYLARISRYLLRPGGYCNHKKEELLTFTEWSRGRVLNTYPEVTYLRCNKELFSWLIALHGTPPSPAFHGL